MTVITLPETLLIYYGWPQAVRAGGGPLSLSQCADLFGQYDRVVWGNNVASSSHGGYSGSQTILGDPAMVGTEVFGYIPMGIYVNGPNLTINDIISRITDWSTLASTSGGTITGIFLDEFGYDYGNTRTRQNQAVDAVHNAGYKAFVNAWNLDDIFSLATGNTSAGGGNPTNIATTVTTDDRILVESYWLAFSALRNPAAWATKSALARSYRTSFGIKIDAVDTTDYTVAPYNQGDFNYSYYSSMMDEFDSYGWGEPFFGSGAVTATPFRQRPDITSIGDNWTAAIASNDDGTYTRTHDDPGSVILDPTTHTYTLT